MSPLMWPLLTPASSQASCKAVCGKFLPSIGHPLGMIQQPEFKLVTIKISFPEAHLRVHNAATCRALGRPTIGANTLTMVFGNHASFANNLDLPLIFLVFYKILLKLQLCTLNDRLSLGYLQFQMPNQYQRQGSR